MEVVDVAIVGAGPAGLTAAVSLADSGAEVVVIDEQAAIGGQIYRQPPHQFVLSREPAGPGARLIDRAESHSRLRVRLGRTVWAILDERDGGAAQSPCLLVALSGPDGFEALYARRVLLATGAYDLPVAFPGWTLPGVMSAGGLQAMLKSQRLLPGRRFVLAGAHPLLLLLAGQLLAAGAEIAEVALSQQPPGPLDALAAPMRLGRLTGRVAQLARPAAALLKARVPVRFSTVIAGAIGEDRVTGARLARLDDGGSGRSDAERDLACDTIAVGYGFLPSTELARQAGCTIRWQERAGGWIVAHDEWMRTTREAIFAAGEITGVTGAQQGALEGHLAAIGIQRDLKLIDEKAARRAARGPLRKLARERRFSRMVQERFAVSGSMLSTLPDGATPICRCEEVTADALRAALGEYPHLGQLNAVKLRTRIGMGPCQGRMCAAPLAREIARARGTPLAELDPFTAQPPAKPVSLAELAQIPWAPIVSSDGAARNAAASRPHAQDREAQP